MPKGINVSAWHNVVSSKASQDVPPLDKETKVRPISIFSPLGTGDFEVVEFTSQVRYSLMNLILYTNSTEHHFWHCGAQCDADTRQQA